MIRTTYSFDDFYNTIKNKINEFSSNKPTFWGNGSIASAIVKAVAYFNTYIQLQINIVYMSISRISTAVGLHLERKVEDLNVTRKSAVASISEQMFIGSSGRISDVTIPEGFVVATQPDYFGNTIQFSLMNDLVLTTGITEISGYCQCNQVGTIGNIVVSGITSIPTDLTGIQATYNISDIGNGADVESDVELRKRVPSTLVGLQQANNSSILAAAYSVEGIIYADIIENYPNNGTFTLFVTTENGIVDNITKAKVKDAVDLVRAFTVTPNIIAPVISYVTITFDLSINTDDYNSEALNQLIQSILFNYLNSGSKNNLYKSDIISIVTKVLGVNYIDNILINGSSSNIELEKNYTIKVADVSDIVITNV